MMRVEAESLAVDTIVGDGIRGDHRASGLCALAIIEARKNKALPEGFPLQSVLSALMHARERTAAPVLSTVTPEVPDDALARLSGLPVRDLRSAILADPVAA
jgi:hypothetical protein